MALDTANRARAAFSGALSNLDVVLTYSALGAAPKGLGSTGDARFNRLWTLLGVPRVNVPADIADDGLPVGVTDRRAVRRGRQSTRRRALPRKRVAAMKRLTPEPPHRQARPEPFPGAPTLHSMPQAHGRRRVRPLQR